MALFEAIVVAHVVTGTVGLVAFWGPIVTRKGASNHRKWGKAACYGFLGAGSLAIAMALLSLYGPEERIPSVTDRELFAGLFGWMMLYLGMLTIGFVDYGLAVVRHARDRRALRSLRYQGVIAAVVVSALWCGWYGIKVEHPLMVLVAVVGLVAMTIQQVYIWRSEDPPKGTHVGEHFRALIGMGISAYTAFLSVGLIRMVPEHVFNPAIWAGPSVIGVSLIIWFTIKGKRPARAKASGVRPHPQ
ncbi:SemiSWEET family transporter [Erythrobacter dokdonensis]|uniref:Putative membrane protein n=1 Tax=Erythrobacter dokdonensis DSW-74 TaxID=1300349 RepID=A0A1A7BHV7_9SPHN|nr:SemiSWEET family transporter [Erythrobacter dokdonensis]OBV11301.1 putative membrane protein [Erythrobacter dokdonensis DSW-74]